MPEEKENPIERREPGGGIGRRSDIARRGMNAANYVRELSQRGNSSEIETISATEFSYPFFIQFGGKDAANGLFDDPDGLVLDVEDNVYVTDSRNHRIQMFDPRGQFLRKWGEHGRDDGQFSYPRGLALDVEGNVYVADSFRIQVFDPQGRFLRKWGGFGRDDGQFSYPSGLALDVEGNVYLAEAKIPSMGPLDLPDQAALDGILAQISGGSGHHR